MGKKGEDPMSGLLNNVGGIDAGLFSKPQAMRDMRGKHPAADVPHKQGNLTPSPVQQKPAPSKEGQGPYSWPEAGGRSGPAKSAQSQGSGQKNLGSADANRQLNAMLGQSLSLKSQRPMREVEKPQITSSAKPVAPVSSSQAPKEEQRASVPAYQDNLDDVFGASNHDLSNMSSAARMDDPFALFGGLGTTQASKSATAEPATNNLLGNFTESSSGAAPPQARSASQVASPLSTRQSQKSFGGSDDWGSGWDAEGLVSPVDSVTSQKGNANAGGDSLRASYTSNTVEADERHFSGSSLPDVPPPSYESVVTPPRIDVSSPRTKVGSPSKHKGMVSPKGVHRRDGSGPYQAFKDEDPDSSFSPQPQKIPAHIKEHRQQHQNREHDMKEQARQWLSAGKGWLSDAGKKVAQAVKDTQAQINHKIDELDARHTQGPGQGAPRSRRSASSRSQEKVEVASTDIPKYYYEWAETIAALPTPEQVNTLAAMPEDDAKTINKILRQKSRRVSLDTTEESMLAEAKRRSLSTSNAVASRPTGNQSAQDATAHLARSDSRSSRPRSASSGLPDQRPEPFVQRPGSGTIAHAPHNPKAIHSPLQPVRRDSLESQARRTVTSNVDAKAQPQETESHDLMGFGGQSSKGQVKEKEEQVTPQKLRATERKDDGSADFMGFGSPDSSRVPADQASGAEESTDLMGSPYNSHQTEAAADETSSKSKNLFGEAEDNPFAASLSVDRTRQSPAQQSARAPQRPERNGEMDPSMAELMGHAPRANPATAQRQGPIDSMIDFGDEGPSGLHSSVLQASVQDEEQAGEPEERKIARRKRLAEKHARIQKQLDEKLARDKAEEDKREAQYDLRAVHRERIEAWKAGKKDNIRALLSTLHTVLWEGSGWTAPGMTDLVEVSKVKKCYMRANLVVHPDKVKQKGGSVEQIVIADMAFDTLKTAWNKFESSELRR